MRRTTTPPAENSRITPSSLTSGTKRTAADGLLLAVAEAHQVLAAAAVDRADQRGARRELVEQRGRAARRARSR